MIIILRRFANCEITCLSSSVLENSTFMDKFKGIQSVQVNIIITETLSKPEQFFHSSRATLFHYIVGSESDIHSLSEDLLQKFDIDISGCLLSKRELDVLQALNCFATTKQAAAKLHISDRTLNNHRYNISRKTGMSAVELAAIVYQTDNIRLVSAMLKSITGG